MGFPADSYVCLDLPPPVGDAVMAVRRRHRDEFRAALPAEITVAGSGGVGVIDPAEDRERVFATLDRIAAETPPIQASFGPVIRFPNTDIFVLSLADPAPVRALHERIARSGLRFRPVPFDFTPHCTLRSRSPVTEEEAADLLAVAIAGGFVLDAISVYMLDQLPMTLLHRTKLMGKRGA